ncbi:hypothetical protein EST38_g9022 [Candolleomyces aberdarensis]|uniref:Uncharacterized protein n=1 Tax=Candolleomyces aberdarensis TaxID=2316362 RepID=A0A4Q2DB05_9AGAR|nr:hypothetical protein EST38_g9022 [Candolleomyces aberdarensis]
MPVVLRVTDLEPRHQTIADAEACPPNPQLFQCPKCDHQFSAPGDVARTDVPHADKKETKEHQYAIERAQAERESISELPSSAIRHTVDPPLVGPSTANTSTADTLTAGPSTTRSSGSARGLEDVEPVILGTKRMPIFVDDSDDEEPVAVKRTRLSEEEWTLGQDEEVCQAVADLFNALLALT